MRGTDTNCSTPLGRDYWLARLSLELAGEADEGPKTISTQSWIVPAGLRDSMQGG
jgi:hypothetical protein